MVTLENSFSYLCVLSFLTFAPFALNASTDLASTEHWYVDTERLAPHNFEIRRGESRNIEPTFRSYTTAIDLSTATNVVLNYKSADMTNYYCATGAVLIAASGSVRVPWTSTNNPTATNLTYDLIVSSSNSAIVRCYGTITMLTPIGYSGTATNPPTLTTANWTLLTQTATTNGTYDLASDERWYVDTERLSPHNINIRRGETRNIKPSFRSYSAALDLTAARTVVMAYRSADMTNFYAATGTVTLATNGAVCIPWGSAQVTTNNTLSYDIIVASPSSTIARCYGTITLDTPVGYAGASTTNPTAMTSIDWSLVTQTHQSSAGFLLTPSTKVYGDMFYYDGTNYARFALGTVGQTLQSTTNGPAWGSAGSGDMAASMYDPDGAHTTAVYVTDARLTDSRTPLAHSNAWETITGTPTSISGYGITNQIIQEGDARLTDSRSPVAHTQTWSTISGTPVSLSGYGITNQVIQEGDSRLTDARIPLAHSNAWGTITGAPQDIVTNNANPTFGNITFQNGSISNGSLICSSITLSYFGTNCIISFTNYLGTNAVNLQCMTTNNLLLLY